MIRRLPKVLEDRVNAITDDELRFRGWTREGIRAGYLRRLEQDEASPRVGEIAPDFELERMTPSGERARETIRLSSLRGRPVGLIFGSYT